MKNYFITLIVLLFVFPGFAQEVIVIDNDTTSDSGIPSIEDQANELGNKTKTGFGELLAGGFTGDTALLLISGGLFILLFVVPLAMVNSIFWKKTDVHQTAAKIIRPSVNIGQRYDLGLSTGSSLRVDNVDDIIDTLKYLEDVDVKIVNSTTTHKTIRIKGCRACHDKSSKKPICDFERGFLQGAFCNLYKSVDVKEVECHAQGNSYCEFEVKLKR